MLTYYRITINDIKSCLHVLFFIVLIFESGYATAQFQYTSPMPGARMINPEHNVILREGNLIDASSLSSNLFSISGNKSGEHSFNMVLANDGKTILLKPKNNYACDEEVTVTIHPGLRKANGENIGSYSFSFSTHREYTQKELQNFNDAEHILEKQEMIENGIDPDVSEGDLRDITGSFDILTNTAPSAGDIFYENSATKEKIFFIHFNHTNPLLWNLNIQHQVEEMNFNFASQQQRF